jgi:uncharacterized membrane protein (DUF2068 family)
MRHERESSYSIAVNPTPPRHRGLQIIGGFKIFKGALLLLIAGGLTSLLHKDVSSTLMIWAHRLNMDTHTRIFQDAMEKVLNLSPNLPWLSIALFVYGALFLTEGIGLILGKRWAEYLTVIVTGSFLPFEIYEMVKKASAAKGVTIAVNLVIVIYLIIRLKKDRPDRERR